LKIKRFHGEDIKNQDFKRNYITVETVNLENEKEYSLKQLRKERPFFY
jgi:hypothetical protein